MTTTTTPPTKQPLGPNQERWLAALESGEFKQGYGLLRTEDDKHCCLGVGCRIFDIQGSLVAGRWQYLDYNQENLTGVAPDQLVLKLALYNLLGRNKDKTESLVALNDSGKTFAVIAAIVRQDPAQYFSQPK